MQHPLTWRKNFFESDYQLFSKDEIRGSLIFSSMKNNARGIALHNYYFTTEGFANPVTRIRDEHHHQIGVITYQLWKLKAAVVFNDTNHVSWYYTNGRLSQWAIQAEQGEHIQYSASASSGVMQSNTDNEVLLLTGLFIREFFRRMFVVLLLLMCVAVLVQQA